MNTTENHLENKTLVLTRIAVRLVCLALWMITSLPTLAAEKETYRILVLHGTWHERQWESQFDLSFSEELVNVEDVNFEISYQYVGVDSGVSDFNRAFYSTTISTIIESQGVDLLVAVLPAAISFIQELENIDSVPKVLALPSVDSPTNSNESNIKIVESEANKGLRKTIEAISKLHPSATTIELFAGAGEGDLAYLDLATETLENQYPQFEVSIHNAPLVSEAVNTLGQLDSTSVVLMLPFTVFRDGQQAISRNSFPVFAGASTVPVYSFVETAIGLGGLTGGYVTRVSDYAAAAKSATLSLLNIDNENVADSNVRSGYLFDNQAVERWGLQLDLLEEPFVLINKPTSVLDEYRQPIIFVSLLLLLLVLTLIAQFRSLRKTARVARELQQSEQQARESEVRFEILTQNSHDVIWTWNLKDSRLSYCSASVEQLAGYTLEEYLSLSLEEMMTTEALKVTVKNAFAKGKNSSVYEAQMLHKDGSKIWCEIAIRGILDEAGEIIEWVGISRDIRKRKFAESERHSLESQVRQSQKFESLGTLAGGIAHDFNNMLGVVMGLTELLKLKYSSQPDARVIVEKLMYTTDKAKTLVGQILSFSRQSSDSQGITDLRSLALDAVRLAQSGIPHSIEFTSNVGEHPVLAMANGNQLSQVLISILTNAYEAIDGSEGQIVIDVETRPLPKGKECLHGRLPVGDYALVRISDTGVGLTPDRIEKIFDPFYTSKDLGSGMGLAIARGIVIAHHGAIDIESAPYKGTAVTLYFPLIESKAGDGKPSRISEGKTTAKKSKILLIDDQADLLETLGLMLNEMGHDCVQCSDPSKAMQIISTENKTIDLVITDFSMPEFSGMDIVKHCERVDPLLPVVLSTGYNESISLSDESVKPILTLNKPYGFSELKELLHEVL